MRKLGLFAYNVLLTFVLFGALFIPFSFHYINFQSKIAKFFFEDLILFIASGFKKIDIENFEISSDSIMLYLFFGIMLFTALTLITLLSFFNS